MHGGNQALSDSVGKQKQSLCVCLPVCVRVCLSLCLSPMLNGGAASQHVLRMSSVPEQEAHNFDRQVSTFWSTSFSATSPLHFSFCLSNLEDLVWALQFSDMQRPHGVRGNRSFPTLMATTQSPDTETLSTLHHHSEPNLSNLQTNTFTAKEQANFAPQTTWVAALRQKKNTHTHTKKKQVSTIQRNHHKQLLESLTDTPVELSVLLSQSTSHTGAHLMQPSSEAYEAEDRCFRVAVARKIDDATSRGTQCCRCRTIVPQQKCSAARRPPLPLGGPSVPSANVFCWQELQ